MKKIFTLFFALFTLAFYANAQVPIFSENFDSGMPTGWTQIDANNDGYNWEHSSNPVSYFQSGVDLSGSGHDGSTGFILSGSYSNVTNQAITPDNWLITPSIHLTSPSNLSFWVCAQDASYAQEHYGVYISTTNNTSTSAFTLLYEATIGGTRDQSPWENHIINLAAYDGQTVYIAFRHFNCNDMFVLNLDDVEVVAQPTEPTIIANTTTIDFGTVNMPGYATANATITTYNLTAGITATAAAPFEVSADGNTYAATATIAQTGGTLYVKYTPTTAGTHNGTVTLTSGTATASIALTGYAVDCSNITLPFVESFESADCPASCWTIIYGDNDPSVNTMLHSVNAASDGLQSFRFSSYSSTSDYSEYLITPALPSGNRMLFFDYAASNSYAETFQVGYSSTGTNPSDFTWSDTISATNADGWQTYAEDVPANAVYVALKYFSNYMYYLYIDNFRIMEAGEAIMASPSAMDFIGIMGTPTEAQTASLIGTSLTNNITITADAPFEVSVDNGATFAATASIPYSTSSAVMNVDFQVRYNPANAGNHAGIVVLTSGNASDTILVSGNATDCSLGIASLPFLYDFNTGLYPPLCWDYNDAASFAKVTIDEEIGDYGITYAAADYLICPEIHTTSPIMFNVEYATYAGSEASTPTSFRVGYSTTTNSYNDFVWMQTVSVMIDGFNDYSVLLPAGTKYVAVEATEIGTYLMWGMFEYPNYLFLDNFSLVEVDESVIYAGATDVDFGYINVNTTATEAVAITGALLTSDITANVNAPFEISTDNTTFGASATIPAAGGTLYVRYAPTAVGTHNGTVTLTSTGATSVQISLIGNAIDCSESPALPYTCNFTDEGQLFCWTIIDANADDKTFSFNTEGGYAVYAYSDVNNADDYLISPVFQLGATASASFDYMIASSDYPERYAVYVIAAGQTYQNATEVVAPTDATNDDAWLTQAIDLSAFANQAIQIAIKCVSDADKYLFAVTNFQISSSPIAVEEYESNNVSVYPNPATNNVNVSATSNINNVEVYTIAGQKVADFTANGTQTVISTANLTNGLYLMRINTENGTINKKFTVAR